MIIPKDKFAMNVIEAIEIAWNEGSFEALDAIYDKFMVRHESPFPDKPNLEAYKEWIFATRESYPDATIKIDEVIREGNTTATRWTFKGTHTGQHPALPIPPTGKFVEFQGSGVAHWEDDRIVEEWIFGDYMSLFQQIGVIPTMELEVV